MTINKTASGWLVDIQPGGRDGHRSRKTLPTKAEALAYEAWIKTKVAQAPEWQPAKREGRRLLELVELWHKHHGMNLRASKDTYRCLQKLCLATGARWSEAEELRVSQVRNGQLHFSGTKSGKNRSVPVDDVLLAKLDAHLEKLYGKKQGTCGTIFSTWIWGIQGCCG